MCVFVFACVCAPVSRLKAVTGPQVSVPNSWWKYRGNLIHKHLECERHSEDCCAWCSQLAHMAAILHQFYSDTRELFGMFCSEQLCFPSPSRDATWWALVRLSWVEPSKPQFDSKGRCCVWVGETLFGIFGWNIWVRYLFFLSGCVSCLPSRLGRVD